LNVFIYDVLEVVCVSTYEKQGILTKKSENNHCSTYKITKKPNNTQQQNSLNYENTETNQSHTTHNFSNTNTYDNTTKQPFLPINTNAEKMPLQRKKLYENTTLPQINPYSGTPLNITNKLSKNIQNSFGINTNQLQLRESPEVTKMGALATAQGNVIRFAPGQFNPNTHEGLNTLGHELAHIQEQAMGSIKANVKGTNIHYDKVHETQSDNAGEAFAHRTLNETKKITPSNNNVTPVECKIDTHSVETMTIDAVEQNNTLLRAREDLGKAVKSELGGTNAEPSRIYYILYLPEFQTATDNNEKEIKKACGSETDVKKETLNEKTDMTNKWNAMGGGNSEIMGVLIDIHANPQGLGTGAKASKQWFFNATDIDCLSSKNVGSLILSACNAGHIDFIGTNPASKFAQKVNGAPVLASDGTMYKDFEGLFFRTMTYVTRKDEHFKEWSGAVRPNSTRDHLGWVIYQQVNGDLLVTNKQQKKLALIQMLKFIDEFKGNPMSEEYATQKHPLPAR